MIPSLRDRGTLKAQGFWCVARRKTDGYPKITRGMTTQPHVKRTSQKVQLSMRDGMTGRNDTLAAQGVLSVGNQASGKDAWG